MTPDPTEDRPEFPGDEPQEPDEVVPTTEIDRLPASDDLVAAGAAVERADSGATAADEDVAALRDATFRVAFRGYDTHAVDAYVERVERCIARFEESHSPTEAVRSALDRVGEQTAAILREAERSAEDTTSQSRAQADDRLQRAEQEAAATWAAAQARVRGLDDDIERLWQERQVLIDATRDLSDRLRGIAEQAEARFPPAEDEDQPPGAPVRGPSRNGTAGTDDPVVE